MKFIPVQSAKGLEIDKHVYTKDEHGNYGYGRLIKEEKTKEGIVRTFEILAFLLDPPKDGIDYDKFSTTKITHIAIPK